MTDERLDLAALDPTRDRPRHEAAIADLMRRAAGGLAARRAQATTIGQVAGWWKPMLALAAAVTIAAIGILARVSPAGTATQATSGVATALGIPSGMSAWLDSSTMPNAAQVFAALEEDR
jgi:hypothetical protein